MEDKEIEFVMEDKEAEIRTTMVLERMKIKVKFWRKDELVIAAMLNIPKRLKGEDDLIIKFDGYFLSRGATPFMTSRALNIGRYGSEESCQPCIRLFENEAEAKKYIAKISELIRLYNMSLDGWRGCEDYEE